MIARVQLVAVGALGLAACSVALDFDFETREGRPDARSGGDLGGRDAGTGEPRDAGADAAIDAVPLPDQRIVVDGPEGACVAGADTDEDGVGDLDEGCVQRRDSDGDTVPDYLDSDSDDDGIVDLIEFGVSQANSTVADTDKDGYENYIDLDSDGDGVLDQVEDADGDGNVGCCTTRCGQSVAGCAELGPAECGDGQQCAGGPGGLCDPPAALRCAHGESDVLRLDTFGLGFDGRLGNVICAERGVFNPNGRRPITLYGDQGGDWTVALPEQPQGPYHPLSIGGGGAKQAAAVFHYTFSRLAEDQLFGFVASVPSSAISAKQEVDTLLQELSGSTLGSAEGGVIVRASGAIGRSPDGFATVRNVVVDLSPTSLSLAAVRQIVLSTLFRGQAQITGWPEEVPAITRDEYVLRLVATLRGDQRVVYMGALTVRDKRSRPDSFVDLLSEDMANGSALRQREQTVGHVCDTQTVSQEPPPVDIIWVIDESGSMRDNRGNIANNAGAFFDLAETSGLDFRMGVTNVVSKNDSTWGENGSAYNAVGMFCSVASLDKDHSGLPPNAPKGDPGRFLRPSEREIFSACIENPPGFEGGTEHGLINTMAALERHIPRAVTAPSRVRVGADVVVIVATDELPIYFSGVVGLGSYDDVCELPTAVEEKVQTNLKPWVELFTGVTNPDIRATFHVIGGLCSSDCSGSRSAAPDIAHGYLQLALATGGQSFDICQTDLGPSMQLILEEILARASPLVLPEVPVSSSLRVALNGEVLARDRLRGFNYYAPTNSIIITGYGKLEPGSVVSVSYTRWGS